MGRLISCQKGEDHLSWDITLPLFLFHTCIGSGPDPPCLDPKCEDLGVEALVPLAVFATSRGRGAGGIVEPATAGFVAVFCQPLLCYQSGVKHHFHHLSWRLARLGCPLWRGSSS